ncbi:hypothetical protein ACTPOK_07685 [Streptomyces inhibens]|uniref:hypothetical protein n=1 Tax=Streptomyces inhibens TaxID=2293571 RepID=UPI00402AE362
MSEIPTHTLQHRFDGLEDAPVLITGKAPHPYQRIMVSYGEPSHPVVCTVSTVRL